MKHTETLTTIIQNFRIFSNTPYYSAFPSQLLLSIVPLCLSALLCICTFYQYPFLSCSLFFILCLLFILHWRNYYRTVIAAVLKMERLKEKYTLINADQMTDYTTSLLAILDLIDSSMEREYSNKLLQKQAEFDAMKSQINPHFLYNTLDTIRGYALIEQAPITSDMIEVLSRLFRYTISQKNELITLRQELSILYDYIKIQEYRINQHIVFLQKIDPDLKNIMDYKMPKLIIQPFIENAIKHGLKDMTKDFVITLHVFCTQSRLIISIADNGSGMTTQQLNNLNQKLAEGINNPIHEIQSQSQGKGTGIALTNVNARIRLIFGPQYGVIAYSTLGNGSEFQISLPYHKD